jgi:hypothetical protein
MALVMALVIERDPPQSPLKRGKKKLINIFSSLFNGGWGGSTDR